MNRSEVLRAPILAFCLFAAALRPIHGAEWADALALDPPTWDIGNLELRLGGMAGGALFSASHDSGYNHSGASGIASANLRAERIFDNGMIVGAGTDLLLYHDRHSGDQYGNDTFEKLYAFVQTGFGRVEIGQQDGAAFTLGLVGPVTNDDVTLENRNISLFRNPVTGDDFASFFESVTSAHLSSNYPKINYITPRLFGVQIGASFTPDVVRSPLPFTGNPANDANRQHNIFEFAVNYTDYVSDVAVGLSAAYAHGGVERTILGAQDLQDIALGVQFAYMLSDVRLSAGGAYRVTNAYLLDIEEVGRDRSTHALHLSAMAERGPWLAGVEFSDAEMDGPTDYDITGYQISAGYRINDNLQITGGWQWYDYRRNVGSFYNAKPHIDMNAGFLALSYAL